MLPLTQPFIVMNRFILLLLLCCILIGASAQDPTLSERPELEFLSDVFDELAIDHEQDWGVLGKDSRSWLKPS